MKRLLVIAGLCGLLFTSCSTERNAVTGWNYNTPAYSDAKNTGGLPAEALEDQTTERLVNFGADLRLNTKEPDTVMTKVVRAAKKYGGYVQSMSSEECKIRVRSENFMSALNEVSSYGKVIDKNIRSIDITDQYNDQKIRLENSEKARQRYMELLQKAGTIDEILRVEREIDRLTLEIEQIKGRIAVMNEQVYYSTITVNVNEKAKPGVVSYVFIGLYKGARWLFVRG